MSADPPPAVTPPSAVSETPSSSSGAQVKSSSTKSHLSHVTTPFLSNTHASMAFGRMDSDYVVIEHTLNIDNQETVAHRTYHQMQALITLNLAITEAQFIRMWKTLILKRVQDVYESEKSRRSDNFVRLIRNIILPGPLADLLHSLGFQHSKCTGVMHHIIPPDRPANAQPWWQVDPIIVALWNQEMHRMKGLYTMKEFPSLSQCSDRPLMLTLVHEADEMAHVKAWTNEPTMTDAVVRLVNDDLFAPHPYITFANAHLIMTYELNRLQAISEYVASYVILSNS